MEEVRMNRHVLRNVIWGLVLIGLGVIFILFLTGTFDFDKDAGDFIAEIFTTYWPVLLIVGGLSGVLSSTKDYGSHIGSMILVAIGSFFLMRNLGMPFAEHIKDIWKFIIPAILIGTGLSFLLNPGRQTTRQNHYEEYKEDYKDYEWQDKNFDHRPPYESSQSDPKEGKEEIKEWKENLKDWKNDWKYQQKNKRKRKLDEEEYDYQTKDFPPPDYDPMFTSNPRQTENRSGFIGDIRIGGDYWELHPMNISYFIGDTKIDMTKAMIPYGRTDIHISAFIGDVKIFLPNDIDLEVKVKASSVIGDMKIMDRREDGLLRSMNYQTPFYGDGLKQLVIHVSLFIGDVSVKKVG
ncbi:hypothetical protein B5S25_14535 [Paenibacillus larvae subsp. pulvifaciens]|nr:hypothetical protein B5S25_14535 [Paenibacillus larvae subsp. pulvifaciens]